MSECDKCDSKYTKFIHPITRNNILETLIFSILFYLIINTDMRKYISSYTKQVDFVSTICFAISYNFVKIIIRKT